MDPIAFAISDNLQIRWYGIMMAVSMLLGSYIGARLLDRIGRKGDLIWDGLVYIIFATPGLCPDQPQRLRGESAGDHPR